MSKDKECWQDVMIEHFGINWLKDSYSVSEIEKLAEKICKSNQDLKDAKKHILAISFLSSDKEV